MDLVSIDADEVARLLPYEALVDELAAAHRAGEPLSRRVVFGPDGTSDTFLGLPAWDPGEALGIKLATVFPGNLDRGVVSVQAVYVLFDGTDGSPLAVIDGTELTYRKTAADSALGARFLARDDVTTLLMVGAGGLAPHLVAAHRAVRPSIERVLVWNRTPERAEALAGAVGGEFAGDLAAAVEQADVVCTATMTREPLIEGRWLRPGTHLDLVGAFLPDHREIDDDTVRGADIYVDHRGATLTEGGDLVIPLSTGVITTGDVRGDLFDLCAGTIAGRTDDEAVTLFENGGGGHLDLMTARAVWRRREAAGR